MPPDTLIEEALAMIAHRSLAVTRPSCLLLGSLFVLVGLSAVAWARAGMHAETPISVADLEHLAQQIADPQQRDQLLKTLQALITLARQSQAGASSQGSPTLLTEHTRGLFDAFGELTEKLAMSIQQVMHHLTIIPLRLAEVPTHFREPATQWSVAVIGLVAVILVMLGI